MHEHYSYLHLIELIKLETYLQKVIKKVEA
jgi:hypothetical protein